MTVTIREKPSLVFSSYTIDGPNLQLTAERTPFSIKKTVELHSGYEQLVARMQVESLFGCRWGIFFPGHKDYRFFRKSSLRGIYVCKRKDERLVLYKHGGLHFSIFDGAEQIAAIAKNRLVVSGGNEYVVEVNSDVNATVIVSMLLALNTSEYESHGNTVSWTWNFASFFRKRDSMWQPTR